MKLSTAVFLFSIAMAACMVAVFNVVFSNDEQRKSAQQAFRNRFLLRGASGRKLDSDKVETAKGIVEGCIEDHYEPEDMHIPRIFSCMNSEFRKELGMKGGSFSREFGNILGTVMNRSRLDMRLSTDAVIDFVEGCFDAIEYTTTVDEIFEALEDHFDSVPTIKEIRNRELILTGMAAAFPFEVLLERN